MDPGDAVPGAVPAPGAAAASDRAAAGALPTGERAHPAREALLFAATAILVAAAALYNGYPLVFADTGTYLASSFSLEPPLDRPVFYGLFLRAAHLRLSLWPVVLAQSALVVLLIRRVFSLLVPEAGGGTALFAIAVLVATTPLAWVAGQILPDAWTGVSLLALFLVLHEPRAQRGWRAAGIQLVLFWGLLVHLTHLAVAVALLFAQGARVRWSRDGPIEPRGARRRAWLVVAASVAFALGANALLAGRPFLSRISWTFALSRMVQDGIVQELLGEVCDQRPPPYELCAHRRDLRPSALHFVWDPDSPVQKLGGLAAVEPEARAIVLDSLRRQPWLHVQVAVRSWLDQLAAFTTGDGLQPYDRGYYVTEVIQKRFRREAAAFAGSRQQRGELPLAAVAGVQGHALPLFAGASVAFLCAALVGVRLASRELHVFAWLALLANAAVCGVLSGPFPRYQSRIVWLVPLACLVSLREIAGPLAHRAHAPSVREDEPDERTT